MSIESLQILLLNKKYQKLSQQLSKSKQVGLQKLDELFIDTIEIKLQLFKKLKQQDIDKHQLQSFQRQSEALKHKYQLLNNQLKNVYILGLAFFILQMLPKKQTKQKQSHQKIKQNINIQEKQLYNELLKLVSVTQFISLRNQTKNIKSKIYLLISFIELSTKKFIKNKRKQNRAQIYQLLNILNEINKNSQYIEFCNKIQMILIHLRIYYLNVSIQINYTQSIKQMLSLIVNQYIQSKSSIFNQDITIVLLYNVVKILLGVDKIQPQLFDMISVILKNNSMTTPKNYNQTIFRLFIIIKSLIFKVKQQIKIENRVSKSQKNIQNEYIVQIQGQDQILSQTFSSFLNINLDTTVVQLKQVSRNIVRHRVASLSTIIGFKLGIQNLALNFLQLMHDSPYNNDIQTIKLCFQLFQARQFLKLQHLFQVVLSSTSGKKLKQRQVLIAMCSIFVGIYMQNRQEGLLYAKLNHSQNKKNILREQTLLQHVGFSYYNLAKSQIYLENKKVYLVKALQNFINSSQLNPENYIVTYCMSKIYLKLHDYQNAYKYALQSCKCNRGRWISFGLLACVYMVQRKIQKAIVIIDKLIQKYPEENILYYIRAYIEVNKILLEVEHDQQVQSAKNMDEQIYQITKQKVLKSKSISNFNMYCQLFYNKSRAENRQIDENFFNIPTNFIQDGHQSQINSQDLIGQKYQLLMIIKLFIQIQQLQTAEGLLRTIPEFQQTSTAKYYKALIHLKRRQIILALNDCKKILQKQPMHVDSLLECSLLQNNNAEALNYLTLASKFTNQSKYFYTKGIILSKLGKYLQAHECFIQEGQIAWLEELPQKMYYY